MNGKLSSGILVYFLQTFILRGKVGLGLGGFHEFNGIAFQRQCVHDITYVLYLNEGETENFPKAIGGKAHH